MLIPIRPWHSLRNRIPLVTLTIVAVSLWALSYMSVRMLRTDMERQLSDQQFSTVSTVAASVNSDLNLRFDALKRVAGITAPFMHDKASLQAFLANRQATHSMFNAGIIVYTPDFTALADCPEIGRAGVNYSDRDSVVAAIKEGKASISSPAIGKLLQSPSFLIDGTDYR